MNYLNLKNKNLITALVTCTALTQMLPSSSLAGATQSKPAKPTKEAPASAASTASAASSSDMPKTIPLGMANDEAQFEEIGTDYNTIVSAAIDAIGTTEEEALALADKIAAASNSSSLTSSFLEISDRIKILSNHYEKTDLKQSFIRITTDQDINTAARKSDLFTKSAHLMQDLYTSDGKYKELSKDLDETIKEIKVKYPNYSFKSKSTNSPLLIQDLTAENIDKIADFGYVDFRLHNNQVNKPINSELFIKAMNLIRKGVSLKQEKALAKKQAATSILQNSEQIATTLTSDQYRNFESVVKLLSKDIRKDLTPSEISHYAREVATDSNPLACGQFARNYNFHSIRPTTSTKQAVELALKVMNKVKGITSPQASCTSSDSQNKANHKDQKQTPAANAGNVAPPVAEQKNNAKEEEKEREEKHPKPEKHAFQANNRNGKDEANEPNPLPQSPKDERPKTPPKPTVEVEDAVDDEAEWIHDFPHFFPNLKNKLADSGNLTESQGEKYHQQISDQIAKERAQIANEGFVNVTGSSIADDKQYELNKEHTKKK